MRRDPRATARMRGCFAFVAKQRKPFTGKKNTEKRYLGAVCPLAEG